MIQNRWRIGTESQPSRLGRGQNNTECYRIIPEWYWIGTECSRMFQNDSEWSRMIQNDTEWYRMIQYGHSVPIQYRNVTSRPRADKIENNNQGNNDLNNIHRVATNCSTAKVIEEIFSSKSTQRANSSKSKSRRHGGALELLIIFLHQLTKLLGFNSDLKLTSPF